MRPVQQNSLACYQFGGTGPVVILLHGLLGSKANMAAVAKALCAKHRVFAVDLRNHGDSPHDMVMTYQVMAADLLHFMDVHELESGSLVGHSMGGKCAMQLALDAPARVERLAVVDIAPRTYGAPFWQHYLEAMAALDLAGLASRKEADALLSTTISAKLYRNFLLSNLSRSLEGGYYWKVNLAALLQAGAALAGPVSARGSYGGPALFIRGGRSNSVRDDDLPLIKKRFPASRLITLENAGHLLHVEAKERFSQELVAFLQTNLVE